MITPIVVFSAAYAWVLDTHARDGERYLGTSQREIWWEPSLSFSGEDTAPPLQGPGATGRFVAWSDGRIYDPHGNLFIPKGTNIGVGQTQPTIINAALNCWRFNIVRLVVTPGAHISRIKRTIDAWRASEVVVLAGFYHRAGVLPTVSEAQAYFSELAPTYASDPYVWLQTATEPQGRSSVTTVINGQVEWLQGGIDAWIDYNRQVIQSIRSYGFTGPIVVSAVMWAQDLLSSSSKSWEFRRSMSEISSVAKYGPQIKEGFDNIIFDIHAYMNFAAPERGKHLGALAEELEAHGHAFLFGEFNAINARSNNPAHIWSARHVFNNAPGHAYGRLQWRFSDVQPQYNKNIALVSDTDTNGGGEHINSCTNPTNLTPLGQMVWDDAHHVR